MPTIQEITDDIAVTIGETFDDAGRLLALMRNVVIAIDKVKSSILEDHLKKNDYRGASDSATRFIVTVDTFTATDDTLFDYHAFVLPAEIYSLPYDGGISWVRYHKNGLPPDCPPQIARARFTGTSLDALTTLYGSAYQTPCAKRPYYARDDKRVYIFGVDPSVKTLDIGLFAAIPPFAEIDPDAQVSIPPESMMTVKRLVLSAERFALQIPEERLKNDGRDLEPNQVVRTDQTISVNDPILRDE